MGHSSKLTCHPGVRRTVSFLRQSFWWSSLKEDTLRFAACPTCCGLSMRTKLSPARPWGSLASNASMASSLPCSPIRSRSPVSPQFKLISDGGRGLGPGSGKRFSALPVAMRWQPTVAVQCARVSSRADDVAFHQGPSVEGEIPQVSSKVHWSISRSKNYSAALPPSD